MLRLHSLCRGKTASFSTTIHPADTSAAKNVGSGPTTRFSGTHLVRLFFLSPWILGAVMPTIQQLVILHPPTFSSPVALTETAIGTDLHPYAAFPGFVTFLWAQLLEARRRQRVPPSKQGSRWGGCTIKDARSITVWTSFDCFEFACICASVVLGITLSPNTWMLAVRLGLAITWPPFLAMFALIVKRTVHAIVYVQREAFSTWVIDRVSPVFLGALLLQVVILLMWTHLTPGMRRTASGRRHRRFNLVSHL